MKARITIVAAALAALMLLSAGCKKHFLFRIVPGEQIQFRAQSRPSGDNAGTRSVYSGQEFTVDGTTYERIDWEEDDMISIGYVSFGGPDGLCVEYDHYRLKNITSSGKSSFANTIEPTGGPMGANGLRWRNNTHHRFLATHPAVDGDDEEFVFGVVYDEFTVKVPYRYPETQIPVGTEEKTITFCGEEATATVYKPDMSHAYQFCNPFDFYSNRDLLDEKYTPADGMYLESGATINLPFEPHFTAFEISAAAKEGDSFTLNSVTLSSDEEEGTALTGTYFFQLFEDEEEDNQYWTDIPKNGDVSYQATINFSDLTLSDDNPVVFTYILSSWKSFSMLTLTFNITKDGVTFNRSLKLQYADSSWIIFGPTQKHRIRNLRVPVSIELGTLWYASDGAGNYLDGGDPFDGEI